MPNVTYFLGANSPRGFYSLYDQLIAPEAARSVYILKGGPGCGKSTLMRRVAQRAEEQGLAAERILCSGDPDSLDAVLLPALGAALVDGTAPHVVEPRLPGAVDHYVNLGACYDGDALSALREKIEGCMRGYRGRYDRAYRCLEAAERLAEDARNTLLNPALETKLVKRADGILRREIRRRKPARPGRATDRFLDAITCQGPVTLYGTASTQCRRIYELADSYALAHPMLRHLADGALRAGYDAVTCPSPMDPERLRHLLIPELGLAFLSVEPGRTLPVRPCRRVRIDAMADPELVRRSRSRLRFARKVSASLIQEAVDSLAEAKAMHDELEAVYNPHVDFDRVGRMAEEICAELFD